MRQTTSHARFGRAHRYGQMCCTFASVSFSLPRQVCKTLTTPASLDEHASAVSAVRCVSDQACIDNKVFGTDKLQTLPGWVLKNLMLFEDCIIEVTPEEKKKMNKTSAQAFTKCKQKLNKYLAETGDDENFYEAQVKKFREEGGAKEESGNSDSDSDDSDSSSGSDSSSSSDSSSESDKKTKKKKAKDSGSSGSSSSDEDDSSSSSSSSSGSSSGSDSDPDDPPPDDE